MATVTLTNGTEGDYEKAASWVGGVAPASGDTAVIDSTGGPAAQLGTNGGLAGNIFDDTAGDSIAELTNDVMVQPDPIFVINNTSKPPVTFEYFPDTSPAAQTTPGETISNQTIDLIGGGSVAALYMQNATLAAGTTLNVSGTALLDNEFNDQLSGTIDIGGPFLVNGAPVTPPPANANGAISELDINLRPAGSWTYNNGSYAFSGYVPTTTNSGTIDIGAGSALRVQMQGQNSGSIELVPNQVVNDPPEATAFVNAGSIVVSAGGSAGFYTEAATPVGAPSGDAAPLETITNTGVIAVNGAAGATTTLTVHPAFSGGTVAIDGGTATDPAATSALFDNTVTDTNFVIDNGTLYLSTGTNGLGGGDANQYTGGAIDFVGSSGVLSIGTSTGSFTTELDTAIDNVTTPIVGFSAGDAIAETFEFGASSPILSEGSFSFQTIWTQATHQLQIQETVVPPVFFGDRTPQTAIIANLTLDGTYNAADFSISYPSDYGGQNDSVTLVITTTDTPCFVSGTMIETPAGEIAVENIRPGDDIRLADGSIGRVHWVGHRRIGCTARPDDAPIRIRAGALGGNLPRRDLVVSPDHALFLDGVLVPAGLLVDGVRIVCDDAERVTYHHVELERHAILLAEGAPAESYLDTGNRARFANCTLGYDPIDAAGNDPCAEVVFGGPRLQAIRARLREREVA